MDPYEDRIRHQFGMSFEAKMALVETLATPIAQASERLVNCLLNDGKILLCGHGGSAANCMHFTAAMLHRFDVERPPLPVFALATDTAVLTGITNEGHNELHFARQIQALGQQNDILLVLTTSGYSTGIVHAVNAAHDRGMDVLALTGRDGGLLSNHLGPEDMELRVAAEQSSLIREMHLFILHCFCDLIDHALFGQLSG
jgi:D-sedoheptulose 7-phosphate isomerase